MSVKFAGAMGFAASLLFAMPALAGTTGVVVQNLSGQTVTVSGTSIGLPSSINNGSSGTGTSSFSSGQPDSGVLTVSGAARLAASRGRDRDSRLRTARSAGH